MLEIYKKRFTTNANVFVMLIVTSIPSMLVEFKYGLDIMSAWRISAFIAILSVFTVPAYALVWTLFLSYFNKYVKGFFIGISVLVMVLDIYCYIQYRILFNEVLLQEICNTNYNEAWEYVVSMIDIKKIIIFILIAYASYKINLSINEKCLLIKNRIPFRPAVVAVITFVMVMSNLFFSFIQIGNGELLPYNKIVGMISTLHGFQKRSEEADKKLSSQKVELIRNDATIPYVVFILGESTSRTHMSLYGYDRDTNPLLTERLQKDKYYVFDDTIASSTHTLGSLKRLFTFYNNESKNEWYENNNLFVVLKKAGYKTYWISNQEPIGLYAGVQYVLAKQCDYNKFLVKNTSYHFNKNYDEDLLPYLDDILAKDKQDKSFLVLHLAGAHNLYRERYPREFEKFHGDNHVDEVIAEYDNAILYNDYVVNEILKRFEKENAIVFYVPDHGEDVYENGSGFLGHGPNGTMHQQEIPMLIWASESFKQKYHDKWLTIGKCVHKPFMTDNLIHAILDVMDIRVNEYESNADLFSNDYDEQRKRIYNNREYKKELVEYDLQEF